MEWIKLIGIAIIVVGFILKFDTIATVVLAGLVTALVSGVSLVEFLEILGKEFSNQRVLTIFMVTLPLVGLSETFGLKQRSIDLIRKIKGLTVGNFYTVYFFIRELAGFFSIRLGGHPQFVRPLVQPMGEAAAESQLDQLGYESNYAGIASASIIVAVITLIVVGIYNYLFDKKLTSEKTRGGEQK